MLAKPGMIHLKDRPLIFLSARSNQSVCHEAICTRGIGSRACFPALGVGVSFSDLVEGEASIERLGAGRSRQRVGREVKTLLSKKRKRREAKQFWNYE